MRKLAKLCLVSLFALLLITTGEKQSIAGEPKANRPAAKIAVQSYKNRRIAVRDTIVPGKAASNVQMELWRRQIRQALFIPDKAPALDPHDFGSFSPMPGVIAHRITYGTQYNMRVPAIVYVPGKRIGKLPAVVIVAGHGGDKTTWYEVYAGLLYAKAGAIVITYDPIGENERSGTHLSEAREHDNVIPGGESPARMGGLMIGDVVQAVSYAASRADVDPKRIAVLGYSMGSFHAAIAAAIDPRISALVLSGGGDLDGNGGAWDSSTKIMCQGGPYQALSFLPDKGAILYALHQQHGQTLILNGLEDGLVTKPNHLDIFFNDLTTRVAAIAGAGAPRLEYRFYPGVAHRPSWVNADAAIWLNTHLRFPNWQGVDVSALPVTHIAEWALAIGAHINKGYADEPREGGIRAVGNGFPAPTHDELQVVPLADWQGHRDDYVWEAWARHTGQAQGLKQNN